MSEKHQQRAQELLPQIITAARAFGADKAISMFAAALEAVEREYQAENAQLREQLAEGRARYRWRPISEIHEDYGDCVLVNIADCGSLAIGSNLDLDFDESEHTHFTRFAPIGQEEYERMKAEADKARAGKGEADAAEGRAFQSSPRRGLRT